MDRIEHLGTRPVRRCWERWPLTFLEPEGMNKEEEIQKNVSKGNGHLDKDLEL
jgi:hypothetical protein